MKIYSNKINLLDESVFDDALKLTGKDVDCLSGGIYFVSKRKIKKLNYKHRGINKVTDVLSFPLLNTKKMGTLNNFDSERDPLTKELELGDIVICKSIAKKQSKQYRHSYHREINFLALHGFLHLLGFDHLSKHDEKEMTDLSMQILDHCGIKRG